MQQKRYVAKVIFIVYKKRDITNRKVPRRFLYWIDSQPRRSKHVEIDVNFSATAQHSHIRPVAGIFIKFFLFSFKQIAIFTLIRCVKQIVIMAFGWTLLDAIVITPARILNRRIYFLQPIIFQRISGIGIKPSLLSELDNLKIAK